MSARDYAVGIDLGTSNSCVGVYRNGRVDIIANEQGQRLTPSFVAFNDEERLIGDSAKYQRSMNPRNTIYEVKRLIGRKYADEGVQNCMKQWPYHVLDQDENPVIKVDYLNTERTFTPEEISAMVLEKMKETAEVYLGCEITKAVITVPAYFTESQRQATIDAGTIAGLEVLKIINEPTAAAIAYGEHANIQGTKNILIFDFGGGTFDVSILTVKAKDYEVKAIKGNSHLGGADLDTRLSEHFLEEFRKKTGLDASHDPKALSKVRTAAEQSKIRLSTQLKDRIQIENLYCGKDLEIIVTRTKFEHMCDDLFKQTMRCVDEALKDSGITLDKIEDVVLVGGSSWIPKILSMLKLKFGTKNIKMTINPAEAVAYGAALQAALLIKDESIGDLHLSDVTAHSLGKAIVSDKMSVIIKRNSKIPAKCSKVYTTVYGHSSSLRVSVYEGENKTASKNRLLGQFLVEGIELAPAGVPRIDVTFELDANGILNVSAVDRKTRGEGRIKITVDKGRLEQDDIDRMVAEMQEIRKLQKEQRFLEDASASFKSTIAKKKEFLKKMKDSSTISKRGHMRLSRMCRDAEAWLGCHSDASKKELDEQELMFNKDFVATLSRSKVNY